MARLVSTAANEARVMCQLWTEHCILEDRQRFRAQTQKEGILFNTGKGTGKARCSGKRLAFVGFDAEGASLAPRIR